MRWLFLIVLSLNIAYITWQLSLPPSVSYENVTPLKNVQPVMLLSELKKSEQEATVKAVAVKGAETETLAVTMAEAGDTAKPVSFANETTGQISVVEKKPVLTEAPEPVKSSVAAAEVAKLQAGPVPESGAVSSQTERCFTLGPFHELDKLRSLTQEIKSYVDKTDFRGNEEKQPSLYWVYLQPESSYKKAVATGERLKAKKIKDYYVIRDGEKKNGLSLGRFKNKNSAYKLAKRVKKFGFNNVVVELLSKTYTVYWLDYQLSSGMQIPESIFNKYISSAKKDKLSRLNRECGG